MPKNILIIFPLTVKLILTRLISSKTPFSATSEKVGIFDT